MSLLVLTLVAASCSGRSPTASPRQRKSGKTTPSTAVPSPSSSTPASVSGLKPEIEGLIDRCGTGAKMTCPQPWSPPAGWANEVNGWVIDATWAELQPTAGGPIAPDNLIDQNLARAQQLDEQDPAMHLAVKLRIFAGVYAPEWAKNVGGAPVPIHANLGNVSGTVGRFWTDAYGSAWAQFQDELAAKYDTNPYLLDVTISRCMTVFAEPFIRDVSDKQTVMNLIGAGYTYQQDEQCQMQEIQEATVWKHTNLSLSFNPYQQINANGTTTTNEAFTEQMMEYCRQLLSTQCVLENNSISTPPNPGYAAMYAKMKELGPPIAFQTAANKGISTNIAQTVQWGESEGATVVELPNDYGTAISPSEVAPVVPQLLQMGARVSTADHVGTPYP